MSPRPAPARSDAAPVAARAGAIAAHRAGRLSAAAHAYDALLSVRPDDAELLYLRGVLDGQTGDPARAIKRLKRAIAIEPAVADFHLNLAVMLQTVGRLEEAEESALRATALDDAYPAGWAALGNVRMARGDRAGAVAAYERAVALDPHHALANNNLGTALKELGRLDEAKARFRAALAANPRYAVAANNLGTAFDAGGEASAAEAWFAAAASLDAAYLEPVLNLAASLEKRGAWDEAIAHVRRALALAPDSQRARWNLALLLLRTGALEEGWSHYEHGVGVADYRGPARPFATRRPRGPARRVLLWGEQGVGDEILYASMVPDLLARRATGVLECDGRLAPLFARSFPALAVVARSDPAEPATAGNDFDLALPTASLGALLRPAVPRFPARRGYLAADEVRVDALRARYAADGTKLVGVSWMSGARRNADAKSTDLAAWGPILRQPGLRFVSLQYGEAAHAAADAAARLGVEILHDPAIDQLRDLDGFAAQVAAMDCVVSVSNTTAHLAGALGVDGIVLLPATRGLHWYWFTGRADSPWYPSLALVRQSTAPAWDDTIAAAARRLAAWRDARPGSPPA